ncbi:hypothetical protein TNCV_5087511 [Trichonephila clavipes]|nr:hypothetical protein TNCV_5087511 [Trichonephila clavipes]
MINFSNANNKNNLLKLHPSSSCIHHQETLYHKDSARVYQSKPRSVRPSKLIIREKRSMISLVEKKSAFDYNSNSNRIAFAKERIDMPPVFWRTVIFSGERKFCTFGIEGRKLVARHHLIHRPGLRITAIEHSWERRIDQHNISSKDMLKSVFKNERKISAEKTTRPVNSMPK